jgi:hypothetical protein
MVTINELTIDDLIGELQDIYDESDETKSQKFIELFGDEIFNLQSIQNDSYVFYKKIESFLITIEIEHNSEIYENVVIKMKTSFKLNQLYPNYCLIKNMETNEIIFNYFNYIE